MNLTPEQAEKVIEHLSNGSRIAEAAQMVEVSWRDFAADWTAGRNDSENNVESDEATFYRSARAARARHCATKRAEAAATAGSRESADLLRYVEALEAEQEPLTVADDEAPNAIRLLSDPDPEVREAARAQAEAGRDLLRALVARDARARASRGVVAAPQSS